MKRLQLGIIAIVVLCLMACSLIEIRQSGQPVGQVPTSPPARTFTAFPTSTPAPTLTPVSTDTTLPPTLTPVPSATPSPQPTATESLFTDAQVIQVLDGDTIEVDIGGQAFKVRYIGINCPETNHPEKGLEPFGPEADVKNAELVEGQTVRLEKDVSETDKYGRLLRYVWVGDTMINEVLVREGYARSSAYPPDVKHQELLDQCEQEARDSNRGLWGIAPTPTVAVAEPPAPAPAPSGDQGYTCDRCIKGNISTKTDEKIYHFPGCGSYGPCRINESKGERWFSSEAEAKAAGWRKAENCP